MAAGTRGDRRCAGDRGKQRRARHRIGTGCPGPCKWGIQTAAIGSTKWRTVSFPAARISGGGVQLVRDGPRDVYAAFFGHTAGGAMDQRTDLLVSHDAGRTWIKRSDPCSPDVQNEKDIMAIAAAPGGVVASLCYPRFASGGGYIKISRDGARTFGPAKLVPDRFGAHTIAIASGRDVFLTAPFDVGATAGPRLFASHDAGGSWSTVITDAPQGPHIAVADGQLVGFPGPTVGYWLSGPTLWTTSDLGRHWALNPAPGR